MSGSPARPGSDLLDRFARIGEALEDAPRLRRLGRLFDRTVLVEVDGEELYLGFERGRLLSIEPGPSRRTPWRFGVRTDRAALDAFWTPLPPPGFHDLFGLVKLGRARIDGDIVELVKHLAFFKGVLALGREPVAAAADGEAS